MTCNLPLEIYVGTIAEPVRYIAIDSITYVLQGGGHTFSFTTEHPIARWELLDRAKVEVYYQSQLIYQGILLSIRYSLSKGVATCQYQCNGYAEHLRRKPVTLAMTGKILGVVETILTEGNCLDFISLVDQQFISLDKQLYDLTVDFVAQYPEQAIGDVCQLLGVSYYIHPQTNTLVLYEPAYLVSLEDNVIDLTDNACSDTKIFNTELSIEPPKYSRVVVCDSQEALNLLARGIDSQEALQTMLSIPVPANAPDRSFPFRMDGEEEKRTITAAFIRANDAVTADEWFRVAGTGAEGYTGDGGDALLAQISIAVDLSVMSTRRMAVALAPTGEIYFTSIFYPYLRKIDADNIITTIGTTTSPISGVPGTLATATLGTVTSMVVLNDGSLVIASNNTLLHVVGNNVSYLTSDYSGSDPFWDGTSTLGTTVRIQIGTKLVTDGVNVYFFNDYFPVLARLDVSTGMLSTAVGGGTNIPYDGQPATDVELSDTYRIYDIAYDNNRIYFLLARYNDITSVPAWVNRIQMSLWYYDIIAGTIHQLAWPFDTTKMGLWLPAHNVPYLTQRQLAPVIEFFLFAAQDKVYVYHLGTEGAVNPRMPSACLLDLNTGLQRHIGGLAWLHSEDPAYQDVDAVTLQRQAAFSVLFSPYRRHVPIGFRSGKLLLAAYDQITGLEYFEGLNTDRRVVQFDAPAATPFLCAPGYYTALSLSPITGTLSDAIDLTSVTAASLYMQVHVGSPYPNDLTYVIDVIVDSVTVATFTDTIPVPDGTYNQVWSTALPVGAVSTVDLDISLTSSLITGVDPLSIFIFQAAYVLTL